MRNIVDLLAFLLRLSRDIRFSRAIIVCIAVAGVISGFASTGMIALVTTVLTRQNEPAQLLAGLFVLLCIALPLFSFLSQMLLIDLTQKALLRFRLILARRILAAPMRHLEQVGPHRLLAALTNDISVIIDSLMVVPTLIVHMAVLVSCLVYLGLLSWVVLLQIVGFIVIGAITYQLPVLRALGHFTRARQRLDDLTRHVRALTEGAKELKMRQSRRRAFLGEIENAAREVQKQSRAGSMIFAVAGSWGQGLFFVVLGLLVFVLPRFQTIEAKTLLGFTVILFQMMVPLEMLMNALPNLGRGSVSVHNLEKLGFSLQSEAREQEAPADIRPESRWDRLELVGVTHEYRGENKDESFVLGPIDIAFTPGELVFLIGGNGSGKTTLAKLILGLYAPESGDIRFDGRVIDDTNRAVYREQFSAVFADFFVFEKLLGLDAAALDDHAREYLRQLRLEQKVSVQDGVLSTIDLSQGQRKRLALLTAYLEDSPIYLFDEWAADQDPLFREIFYLEILPELKARGKTVFVISHDDHYYHVADRILKLEHGRIEADLTASQFLETRPPVGGIRRTAG